MIKIYKLVDGEIKMNNLLNKGTTKELYFSFYYYLSFYFSFGYFYCKKYNMVSKLNEFNRMFIPSMGISV